MTNTDIIISEAVGLGYIQGIKGQVYKIRYRRKKNAPLALCLGGCLYFNFSKYRYYYQ